MRVLMIAQSNFDYDARIIRLSSVLTEKNIDVDLICLRDDDKLKYEVKNGVNVYRIMKNFHQDSIISYVFFSLIFLIRALFKSLFLSIKKKHDLVHVHNMPDYLVFAAAYHKLRGIPIILDIHDLTVELFKEKWSEKRFNRFRHILKFAEKISCNFADHVLTVTKECVEKLVDRGIQEGKITLIMNSADETQFNYSDERFTRNGDNGFKFVYHGTIAPRFGLHYFVNAMPRILKSVTNAEFHIYGSYQNAYYDQLKETIKNLGIENSVFFNHHIPYEKVNEMIRQYDMGIVTYEQTEYMNLAMPTKAGEYALTGLPFIISDLISVRSVFSENSVCYVTPNNIDEIADKVVRLKSDNKRRQEMALSAFDNMLKISWSVMSKKYFALVNKLIQKNK